jgi:hypothetical protein
MQMDSLANRMIRTYEVEFVPGTDVQGTLLPSIKQANVEAVLPSFFASKCGVRRLRRRRTDGRHLEAIGVSSFPADQVLDGVECDERNIVNKANECVVVAGKITVCVSSDVDAERATIERVLKTTMDEKDLVSPNGAVDRITWIGLSPRSQAAQPTEDRLHAILLLVVIVMIALLIVAIIALIVRYTRCQRHTRRDRNIDDDAKALMAGKTSW